MNNDKLAQLKEAYFDLEKSRQEEREAKELAQLLLDGISIVTIASDTSDIFERLYSLLNKNIPMDNFCILQVFGDSDLDQNNFKYRPFFAGHGDIKNIDNSLLPAFLIKKFNQKRTSNIFDIKDDFEINSIFNKLGTSTTNNYKSALISSINTKTSKYLIILTSNQKSFFTSNQSLLIKKFTLIFAQAFEMNHLMTDIITKNKLATFGEMSAGIAHEINNPLTALSGHLRMLKKHINNGDEQSITKAKEYLDKSSGFISRIANIVRGFSVLSRDEQAGQKEKMSLNDFHTSILDLCSIKMKENQVSYEAIISKDILDKKLISNAVQLSQVVINMIVNAVDAIKEKDEKWIQIKFEAHGDSLRVTTTDSGHGIPKKLASNMFQPFYTTKEIGEGTGLGLSISKKIIEEMNGKIYLDDKVPNTSFVFEIPLVVQ
jgi:signal transduction histidine kinase